MVESGTSTISFMHCLRFWLCILILWQLPGCASTPNRLPQIINEYGLSERVISGDGFEHRVYQNQHTGGDYLHIYIAGDGRPWLHRVFVANDPTPNGSLALYMLGLDTNEAVFLGRPCYFGLSDSRNCTSSVWTSARFSERVVSSMVAALETLLVSQPQKPVILFGFSGGGALVTLMAPRLPNIAAVVTVAGNLNPDLWTQQHGYLALKESLNPAELESFPESVRQFHIIGGKDDNVTAAVTQSYVEKHGGEVWEYPGFTHGCCWLDIWPGVLQGVHKKLAE